MVAWTEWRLMCEGNPSVRAFVQMGCAQWLLVSAIGDSKADNNLGQAERCDGLVSGGCADG
jgi:hypothetical protein